MIYFLFFILLIGVIVNELSKKYVLNNVYFYRNFSKKVLEIGEDVFIEIVVENRKILPVTFLQVIEELPSIFEYKFKVDRVKTKDFLYHTITFFLLPYQRIKRKYLATCNKRGRYIFGNIEIRGGDFLGLNVKTKALNYIQDIVVLPKRADLEKDIIPYGSYSGDISVRRWIIEDPTMIIGVREYTGREPAKNIHWPLSLKHGELLVKNFDFTYENNAMIMLNVECAKPYWMKMDGEAIEKCISVTRSIGESFYYKKIPFGFLTNSLIYGLPREENILYPAFDESHLYTFLEYLGRISYNVNFPFEEVIKKFLGAQNLLISTFVIITPYILEEYLPFINAVNSELCKVILVSFDSKNLENISEEIIKYYMRENKNGALIS
ncbi:MAG TPA: DUF58 domain-containing protein [Dictyoglomaceae bacterium]|nr:DUF58 domain-containing protein [Dictyoglomaceae bacterium]HOL39046.1 DUF58 domain-containing protein [Dictyoglomaceae bacterium]HOP94385.1 DUF58 domain-containing protein [Dictyoglomaceae bacterium]HPP15778.1 DUF58 domain-containing protein [Dictyoglomaceae bacterium]HPU42767.1 DUF58 domain-containing protein [Dictyoglomaceae bacterium]